MKSLSRVIDNVLKDDFFKNDPILADLMIHWEEILGQYFFSYSYPKRIYLRKIPFQRILFIGVTHNQIVTEVYYNKSIILERINSYLGKEYFIDELRIS